MRELTTQELDLVAGAGRRSSGGFSLNIEDVNVVVAKQTNTAANVALVAFKGGQNIDQSNTIYIDS
jgi:hypothetical protein